MQRQRGVGNWPQLTGWTPSAIKAALIWRAISGLESRISSPMNTEPPGRQTSQSDLAAHESRGMAGSSRAVGQILDKAAQTTGSETCCMSLGPSPLVPA